MLELYRAAITLRRELLATSGDFQLLESDRDVLAFTRSPRFQCVVNMSDRAIDMPAGRVLLSSTDLAGTELPRDSAVWLEAEAIKNP